MHIHAQRALAYPIFNPERDMAARSYHWDPERDVSAGLTVNIGLE